jgi:hypothetical protein
MMKINSWRKFRFERTKNGFIRSQYLGNMAFRSGQAYELMVAARLATLNFNNLPICVSSATAGAGHSNDISCKILDTNIGIECKTKGGFEGGGRVMKLINDKLSIVEDGLLKTLLGEHVPFGGNIPSFLRGDSTYDTWKNEKSLFKDDYVSAPSYAIAEYYRLKGSQYIQIEGKGIYHTGIDVLNLGVPLFETPTKLRIRTSKHIDRKTGVPRDVTIALQMNKRLLNKSPLCIMTRLEGSLFQMISL